MKYFLKIAALLALFAFPTLADAANRFAVCATTCTWDAASTAMWSTTTGGATGASVPGAADDAIFDGATCVGGTTCTITVNNASINVNRIRIDACTASTAGCILDFSANNNSPTMLNFSSSGTGVRTLNMGSGTWTVSGTGGTPWDAGTATNYTQNANTSTVIFSATSSGSRIMTLGGKALNVLSLVSTGGSADVIVQGGGTIATLNITAPLNLTTSTLTVTNAFNFAGTSSANAIMWRATTSATAITATAGGTFNWAVLENLAFSGGAVTATNSFDLKGNSGVTITAPSGGGGRIIGG